MLDVLSPTPPPRDLALVVLNRIPHPFPPLPPKVLMTVPAVGLRPVGPVIPTLNPTMAVLLVLPAVSAPFLYLVSTLMTTAVVVAVDNIATNVPPPTTSSCYLTFVK